MNVDQMLARHELDRAVSVALGRSAVVAVTAPAGFGKTAAADHWRRFGVDDAGPGAQVEVVDDAHLQPERKLAARVAAARAGGPSVILLGRPAGGAFDAVAADPRTAAVGPQYLALDRRALRERFGDDGDAVYALTGGWPIAVWAVTAGPSESGAWPVSLARYLDEQVLGGLEPSLRRLLLDTAVLGRFRAGTAAAVLGEEAPSGLEWFARDHGLLLVDEECSAGTVYRWPDVVTAAVEVLADQEVRKRHRTVARRAAEHLRDIDPLGAAEYAQKAGAFDLLVDIILAQWPELVVSAAADQVEALLAGLPTPWGSRAEVMRVRACCLRTLGREELIPALLARVRVRERAGACTATWVAAVTDAFLLDDRGAVADTTAHAEAEAAAWCPPGQLLRVRILLATVRVRSGVDVGASVTQAIELLDRARELGDPAVIGLARGVAMWGLAVTGRFRELSELSDEARAEAAEGSEGRAGFTGIGRFAEFFVAYWKGDQQRALALFQNLDDAPITADLRWFATAYYAWLVTESGRADLLPGAVAALIGVPDRAKFGFDWPGAKLALRIRIRLSRNEHIGQIDPAAIHDEVSAAMLAGALADSGDLDGASVLISGFADRSLPLHARLHAEVVRAQLAHRAGDRRGVNRHVDAACALAERSGVLQPLLVAGPTLEKLLAGYVRDGGTHRDIAEDVLTLRTRDRAPDPFAGLTYREHEVLELIAEDLALGEIAAELGVSINTVKTHARTIYRKLGVANRRAAAALWSRLSG